MLYANAVATINRNSPKIGCIGRGIPIGPCTTHPFTCIMVQLLGGAILMLLLSTPIPSREGSAPRVRRLRNGLRGFSPACDSQHLFQLGCSFRPGEKKGNPPNLKAQCTMFAGLFYYATLFACLAVQCRGGKG